MVHSPATTHQIITFFVIDADEDYVLKNIFTEVSHETLLDYECGSCRICDGGGLEFNDSSPEQGRFGWIDGEQIVFVRSILLLQPVSLCIRFNGSGARHVSLRNRLQV